MSDVTLTRAEADLISETLIEMAVKLPMKDRNHAEALDLLNYGPPFASAPAPDSRSTPTREETP